MRCPRVKALSSVPIHRAGQDAKAGKKITRNCVHWFNFTGRPCSQLKISQLPMCILRYFINWLDLLTVWFWALLLTPASDFCYAIGYNRAGVHACSKHILKGIFSVKLMDIWAMLCRYQKWLYFQTLFFFWLSDHHLFSNEAMSSRGLQGSKTKPFLRSCNISCTVDLTWLVPA